MRVFTFLCLLTTVGAAAGLYREKDRAREFDRKIAQVVRKTDEVRQRTALLKEEWQWQNQPDRLADLAERHLALQPIRPDQYVEEGDLDRALTPHDPRQDSDVPIATADPTGKFVYAEPSNSSREPVDPTSAIVGTPTILILNPKHTAIARPKSGQLETASKVGREPQSAKVANAPTPQVADVATIRPVEPRSYYATGGSSLGMSRMTALPDPVPYATPR